MENIQSIRNDLMGLASIMVLVLNPESQVVRLAYGTDLLNYTPEDFYMQGSDALEKLVAPGYLQALRRVWNLWKARQDELLSCTVDIALHRKVISKDYLAQSTLPVLIRMVPYTPPGEAQPSVLMMVRSVSHLRQNNFSVLTLELKNGQRERYMLPGQGEKEPMEELSPAETNVLKLVCCGYKSEEIAEMMNLSQSTIKTHRNKIREKTSCKDVPQLISFSQVSGIMFEL